MAIFFILLAALLASAANYCMRKSIDAGGSARGYLVIQITFSFLIMILLNPVRVGNYTWDQTSVNIGLGGGIIFGLMMWGVGKALERGPPGLTFAVLNSASVLPAVILALLFGTTFGHPYTIFHGLGSLLVVAGLFWAGWSTEKNPNKGMWAFYACIIFLLHALLLSFLQWWAMLLKKSQLPSSSLLPFSIDPSKIQWFMPAVLFVGAFLQIVIYLIYERKMPKGIEIGYGVLGGIINGACTFFLILAPQYATPRENAIIFPIFAVSIIIICNAWAQWLYKERVNWWANILCFAGILIGAIAWNQVI